MSLPFVDRSSSALPVQFVSQPKWRGWLQRAERAAARLDRTPPAWPATPGDLARAARPRRQGRRCSPRAVGQADPVGFRRAGDQIAGRHLEIGLRHRAGVADGCRRRDRARHLALRALSLEEGQGRRQDRLAAGRRQGARDGHDRGDLAWRAISSPRRRPTWGRPSSPPPRRRSAKTHKAKAQGDRGRRSVEAELSRWCMPSAAPARARRA